MKKILSLLLVVMLIMVLSVTGYAESGQSGVHVVDNAGLLSSTQLHEIESMCAAGDKYGCGVYIVTVNDYTQDTGAADVEAACMKYYADAGFGLGPESDGIILYMSMAERDLAFFSHGTFGNTVKSSRFYDATLEAMKEYFVADDWYGGFSCFAERCVQEMQPLAEWTETHPDESLSEYTPKLPSGFRLAGVGICVLISLGLAVLIISLLASQLRSVQKGTEANDYIAGGLQLNAVRDIYTHTTETRVYSPQEKSSGGSSSSGGSGFSGGSSKF